MGGTTVWNEGALHYGTRRGHVRGTDRGGEAETARARAGDAEAEAGRLRIETGRLDAEANRLRLEVDRLSADADSSKKKVRQMLSHTARVPSLSHAARTHTGWWSGGGRELREASVKNRRTPWCDARVV